MNRLRISMTLSRHRRHAETIFRSYSRYFPYVYFVIPEIFVVCSYNSRPPLPVLRRINGVHTIPCYLFTSQFNITFYSLYMLSRHGQGQIKVYCYYDDRLYYVFQEASSLQACLWYHLRILELHLADLGFTEQILVPGYLASSEAVH